MKATVVLFFCFTFYCQTALHACNDTLQFEANDAIRFAKFKDFYRFGEDWTANPDSTGKYWVVTAVRRYTSRKIIKNSETLKYCSEQDGCKVESSRIIKMDKFTGKVIERKKHLKISNE